MAEVLCCLGGGLVMYHTVLTLLTSFPHIALWPKSRSSNWVRYKRDEMLPTSLLAFVPDSTVFIWTIFTRIPQMLLDTTGRSKRTESASTALSSYYCRSCVTKSCTTFIFFLSILFEQPCVYWIRSMACVGKWQFFGQVGGMGTFGIVFLFHPRQHK